jgi:glycosyltransferase involved in cell wall biosynthesis
MRVLIAAFACEPNRGSEFGAGWNWVLASARENDVVVVTRSASREAIERELATLAGPRPAFLYVAERRLSSRGVLPYYLRYLIWQADLLRTIRKLPESFDVVHHLTFGNLFLPALSAFSGVPFVLGPVGGGPTVPLRLYSELGLSGVRRELLRVLLRSLSRSNPITRACWRKAAVIVVQNEETLGALPQGLRGRAVIRPHASVSWDKPPLARLTPSAGDRVAILAGRLLPWKGGTIALKTVALAPGWTLKVIGSGPELHRLGRLATSLGLGDRVEFESAMEQSEFWKVLAKADALLLPSLRDDAPMVVAEAQAMGVPVVAFDRGGARVFAGYEKSTVLTVPLTSPRPELALRDGLDRAVEADRGGRGDGYEAADISKFLVDTYVRAVASARATGGAVTCLS